MNLISEKETIIANAAKIKANNHTNIVNKVFISKQIFIFGGIIHKNKHSTNASKKSTEKNILDIQKFRKLEKKPCCMV